jgi:hypothetical protein
VRAVVRANAAFKGLKAEDLMNLPDHRLINWAAKVLLRGGVSPKDIYKLILMEAKPLLAQHGGHTVQMVQQPGTGRPMI